MKFRKKSVVVEAIQYTGKNMGFITKCFGDLFPTHELWPKMWVVKESSAKGGHVYLVKPDIFEKTYDRSDGEETKEEL